MASSTTVSSLVTNITATINDTNSKVTDNSKEWTTSTAPRIAFLAFFISFGFVGNLFLIITICHSHRFRAITFYIFIINLAVVNLCECVFNMSILLSSSILNEWTFGDVCCSLSVFFLSFVSIETVLGLTVLTVDRLVAVRYKNKYDHVVSTPRISVVIVFTWCQSFCFSIPIAVDAIPTSINNYTKSCVVDRNASVVYGLFAVVFCFIVPLIMMIVMFVKIIRTGYRERIMIRTLISQHSYKDEGVQEPPIKQEIRHSNLTGTTCGAWLCIQGPYLVTFYFNELKKSSELETVSNDDTDYAWCVDLVLLWLRFSYVLVLPVATFTWNKDLWKSFKDLILCRKNNSVVDESFKKNESDTLKLEKKLGDEEKTKEKAKEAIVQTPREQRVFQVPILFATSHGVHIQTSSQANIFESEGNYGQTSTLRGKKCDVIGSRENLNLEEDTSDYDSANEMDPFSVSNPVSVKHLQTDGLTDRQRSVSNPEVRESIKTEETTLVETVGSTSIGDSGLDLSSGTFLQNGNTPVSSIQGEFKKIVKEQSPLRKTDAFETINENEITQCESTERDIGSTAEEKNSVENASISEQTAERLHDLSEDNNEETIDKRNDNILTIKKKKSLNNSLKDSPTQRRKKKKRKEKNLDNISNASDLSCTTLPLRPPPRLAPISASVGLKRPGSSCSSQCSFVENYGECTQCVHVPALSQDRCTECAKNESASCDNLSISSFNVYRNLGNTHSVLKQVGAFDNQTDRKDAETFDILREIKSVPEETFTAPEVNIAENDSEVLGPDRHKTNSCNGTINDAYERLSESEGTPEHTQNKVRNTEARRKRRDKLSTSGVLNDGKGYKRLLPETP